MSRRRFTAARRLRVRRFPFEIPVSLSACVRETSRLLDMSKRPSASKFGSSSADVAESANSTFSGYHDIEIETALDEGAKPQVSPECL